MKKKKVMAVLMAAMVGVSMLAGTATIVCAEEELLPFCNSFSSI